MCTAHLHKFLAYPSSSLTFFDSIASQLSFLIELYIINMNISSICFSMSCALTLQFLSQLANLGLPTNFGRFINATFFLNTEKCLISHNGARYSDFDKIFGPKCIRRHLTIFVKKSFSPPLPS